MEYTTTGDSMTSSTTSTKLEEYLKELKDRSFLWQGIGIGDWQR